MSKFSYHIFLPFPRGNHTAESCLYLSLAYVYHYMWFFKKNLCFCVSPLHSFYFLGTCHSPTPREISESIRWVLNTHTKKVYVRWAWWGTKRAKCPRHWSDPESKTWVNWNCAPCVHDGEVRVSQRDGAVKRRSRDYSQVTHFLCEWSGEGLLCRAPKWDLWQEFSAICARELLPPGQHKATQHSRKVHVERARWLNAQGSFKRTSLLWQEHR